MAVDIRLRGRRRVTKKADDGTRSRGVGTQARRRTVRSRAQRLESVREELRKEAAEEEKRRKAEAAQIAKAAFEARRQAAEFGKGTYTIIDDPDDNPDRDVLEASVREALAYWLKDYSEGQVKSIMEAIATEDVNRDMDMTLLIAHQQIKNQTGKTWRSKKALGKLKDAQREWRVRRANVGKALTNSRGFVFGSNGVDPLVSLVWSQKLANDAQAKYFFGNASMTFDADGNLGIGSKPPESGRAIRALQAKAGAGYGTSTMVGMEEGITYTSPPKPDPRAEREAFVERELRSLKAEWSQALEEADFASAGQLGQRYVTEAEKLRIEWEDRIDGPKLKRASNAEDRERWFLGGLERWGMVNEKAVRLGLDAYLDEVDNNGFVPSFPERRIDELISERVDVSEEELAARRKNEQKAQVVSNISGSERFKEQLQKISQDAQSNVARMLEDDDFAKARQAMSAAVSAGEVTGNYDFYGFARKYGIPQEKMEQLMAQAVPAVNPVLEEQKRTPKKKTESGGTEFPLLTSKVMMAASNKLFSPADANKEKPTPGGQPKLLGGPG